MPTNISIRQQLEAALHGWLVSVFAGSTQFSGVTFAKGQQSDDIAMPLCTVVCDEATEEEVPGLGIYRVNAAIILMTTIDAVAEPDATHQERANLISNRIDDIDSVRCQLNLGGLVYVFGLGVSKSSHSVVERHFVDRFEVDVHCRCV